MRDIIVCDSVAASFVVDRLIVVVVLGVAGYNVPGVKETWQISEATESDVYERVGGADTAFDPDCRHDMLVDVTCCAWRGDQADGEHGAPEGCGLPAIGGKRMAMKARKKSAQDMVYAVLFSRREDEKQMLCPDVKRQQRDTFWCSSDLVTWGYE